MDALGSLEEIAEQTSFRVNVGTKAKPNKTHLGLPPNFERAAAAREKPLPAAPASPPRAAPEIHDSEVISTGIEVTSYTEAIAAIPPRLATVLNIRYEDFDDLAGFTAGLSGKVFGPTQVKRLGTEKFFDALRAAGFRIRLEEDPEQTEKMRERIANNYQPRQAKQARPKNSANLSNKIIDSVLEYLVNKKGGLARLNKAVKEARSMQAQRASKIYWTRKRELSRTGDFTAYLGNVSRIASAPALPPPEQLKPARRSTEASAA